MWSFSLFSYKKLRKTEKSHGILDRAMSRWRHHVKWWRHIKKQIIQSYAEENFRKSHKRNFLNRLWFRSYTAKSRPGGKFTPPLVLCVLMCTNIICLCNCFKCAIDCLKCTEHPLCFEIVWASSKLNCHQTVHAFVRCTVTAAECHRDFVRLSSYIATWLSLNFRMTVYHDRTRQSWSDLKAYVSFVSL